MTRPAALRSILTALAALLILAACAVPSNGPTPPGTGPTPVPEASPPALPTSTLSFEIRAPSGTPPAAALTLVVLDPVTGFALNPDPHPLARGTDGLWRADLQIADGSLVYYRLERSAAIPIAEAGAAGQPISFRLALVRGPTTVHETIAAWQDSPFLGETGRIVGRMTDAESGAPLPEILVSAGGLSAFTRGDGSFILEGLPPGSHTLTAVPTDGAHRAVQQGAVVAAQSATPSELSLSPSPRVQVTFEVTVPADTIPGTPVRLAGNVRQLGFVFTEVAGGVTTSSARMPQLVMADATHYLMIMDLYAGLDLRYKYTLGDGLWNAERDANGLFRTRQVIVPEAGLVVQDTVATWHAGDAAPLTFHLAVPPDTLPADLVTLQFQPSVWTEPLPMWRQGTDEWVFVLNSPIELGRPLGYRVCRNFACGIAENASAGGEGSAQPGANPQDVRGSVDAWPWWGPAAAPSPIVAPEILPREGFEAGAVLIPQTPLAGPSIFPQAAADLADMGAGSVILSPAWDVSAGGPYPRLSLNPALTPWRADVREYASVAADHGLRPGLRPALRFPGAGRDAWWAEAARDAGWWEAWYEEYATLALTTADQARESGAGKLVLGGADVAASLPAGELADGAPARTPSWAEAEWRDLLQNVRGQYDGTLAYEIELGRDMGAIPPFLDAFDQVHVVWRVPLGTEADSSLGALEESADQALDQLLLGPLALYAKPIILVIEYPSVAGGLGDCIRTTDGACLSVEAFDFGADPEPSLDADFAAQAHAYNAMLLQSAFRPEIAGLYAGRYNPWVFLQDKSASVGSKPARDVLWYWFPRLRGSAGADK
jgi:hypothetical protein